MSPALITALCTGIAGVLTAAAGLVKSFRTQANLTAHVSDPEAHQ